MLRGQTALQAANTANTVGFENNIPLLNYQNEMAQTGNVLGLAEGLTGKALSTTTSTGSGGSNTFGGTNSTTTAVWSRVRGEYARTNWRYP